ncbi:unnamed protein product [Staurois parvus]|uniref:Uncharacterized protein n=1 Tax=Staurois parvus TaxID=386267 RepID=A0ABN9CBQ8_9NEOB|nr:unnamed protein product [Staurois parvus]
MAPPTDPHRPRGPNLQGPFTASSSAPGPEVSWALYGLLFCCPLAHLPWAFFQVSHTAGGFSFFIRGAEGAPPALPGPVQVVRGPGFGPVTAQTSEVCGESKIDAHHLHVILTDSINFSLPPSDSKGILN